MYVANTVFNYVFRINNRETSLTTLCLILLGITNSINMAIGQGLHEKNIFKIAEKSKCSKLYQKVEIERTILKSTN